MSESEDIKTLLIMARERDSQFYLETLENVNQLLLEKIDQLEAEIQELKKGELILDIFHLKLFEEVYLNDPDYFSEDAMMNYLLQKEENYRIAFEELVVYGYIRKPSKESINRLYTIPNEKKMKLLSAMKKIKKEII